MGRKPTGESRLTPAEKQALYRDRKARQLETLRTTVAGIADRARQPVRTKADLEAALNEIETMARKVLGTD